MVNTNANTPPLAAPPPRCTFSKTDWEILAQFWHPIAFASEVTGKPFPTRLLDQKLVVWRVSGGIVVANDLCLHRGAALSLGWVENDTLVCGFHGFHYDKTGQCTRIPAHPGAAISNRLCLSVYPAIERYGLIWTCLAGSPMQPLPEWPEWENGAYEIIEMPGVNWQASAGRQTENFNDVAHLSWVHTGTFGHREKPEVERYEVEENGQRLTIRIREAIQHDRDLEGKLPDEISPVHYVENIDLPFASQLLVDYQDGRHLYFYDVPCPTSAQESRIYSFIGRNYAHDVSKESFVENFLAVFAEDRPFVESQCPEEIPLDLNAEIHIPADKLSVVYRKKLAALGLGKSFYV